MIGDESIKAIQERGRSGTLAEPGCPKPLVAKRVDGFADTVNSSSLKVVLAHWMQARGTQAMPSWEQISPARIVHELPLVWAYRYDPETDAFSGRLAGNKICQIFGKNIRGLSLDKIFPPDAVGWTQRLYSRVVQEPALYRSTGRVFSHLQRWGIGERIILPLSSDGVLGDGILGATDYHYPHPSDAGEVGAEEETEQWLCLRPERFSTDHH